jgi:predicted RNA-binding protein with PUA-like domain
MKTEPDVFSFEDLVRAPNHTSHWDGVRNYQARNFMRDEFKQGDLVFIYHSNAEEPGIYGTAVVVREGYPDHTALEKKSKYFDSKSAAAGQSRWVMVDVQARERFDKPYLLRDLRTTPELAEMLVNRPGQRLSIQPVQKSEWDFIYRRSSPKKI